MHEKYSKDVIALATAVLDELRVMNKYVGKLPQENTLNRVCDYVQTLPSESQEAFLAGKKIKESGITQLADTIGRGFASYNLSGNYNDQEHQKGVYNFQVLQQSKFNNDVASLGGEIVGELKRGKSHLKYNSELNPDFLQTALDPLSVTNADPQKQAIITGLTVGMVAKIAGQDTPFKDVLKKTKSLPPELVVAVHEAAVELASDSKYSNLSKAEAIDAGKAIGKVVRGAVAKYEFDNMKLARESKTIDTEAIKDTIVEQVLGKSKKVDEPQREEAAPGPAKKTTPDLKEAREVRDMVEVMQGQQRPNVSSSSTSRSSQQTVARNHTVRGKFTEKVVAEEQTVVTAKQTTQNVR